MKCTWPLTSLPGVGHLPWPRGGFSGLLWQVPGSLGSGANEHSLEAPRGAASPLGEDPSWAEAATTQPQPRTVPSAVRCSPAALRFQRAWDVITIPPAFFPPKLFIFL